MAFKIERHCTICQSPLRAQIDKRVDEKIPYAKISAWAAKNGLKIGKHNISTHKIRHCSVTAEDVAKKRGASKANATAKDKHEQKLNKYVSSTEFLERITADVFSQIEAGTLKPTIDHGLKAIELQAKLKEGNLIEKTLIDFMMQFSPDQYGPIETGAEITDPEKPQIEDARQPLKDMVQTPKPETLEEASAAVKNIIKASREGELCAPDQYEPEAEQE